MNEHFVIELHFASEEHWRESNFGIYDYLIRPEWPGTPATVAPRAVRYWIGVDPPANAQVHREVMG